jgi:hypothetical protein
MSMVKITAEQVEQAEVRAAEKERERDAAARALEVSPYSELAALGLAEVSPVAAQLRASARELRAAFEEQVAAERAAADRGQLEKAAAVEIREAGRDLEERRQGLLEALAAAQGALVGLLAAGGAYNAAVEAQAKALEGVGLGFAGGESGGDRTVLNRYRVKVRGLVYEPVEPGLLAGWVLQRVAARFLGRFDHVAAQLEWVRRTVENESAGLLADVPEPGRVAVLAKRGRGSK